MQFFITTLFLSLVASFSATATTGNDPHAGHGGMHSAAPASSETAMVDGVVKIDKAAGKVTISHGPLTNLNIRR